MTTAEVLELVADLRHARSDSCHVEAKRAESELPRRLRETLSAFSNTPGGGVIVLGLEEASGYGTVGVKDPKKAVQDLASLCDQMTPPVRAVIQLHRIEGKQVVVAEVPEMDRAQKPCYYPGTGLVNGAFIRVADGDRKLTPYEVQLMLASRGQPREDETPVAEASEADLEPGLVAGLLSRLRASEESRFRRLSDTDALKTLKALVPCDDRWVPSLAGLLALGVHPQRYFPALATTLVVYPTARVGEAGPRGERFLDNRRIEGAIPATLGPALEGLRRNMKRRAVVRGLFREDLWEYPDTAIREALVNALAHRDLSGDARGSPVQIQMFPDRLVITNPGGLHGPVTLDRLGEEGVSSARNQVLMRLLEDVSAVNEAHAICENRGSGIGAMLASLRQAGMGPPRFEDRISTFQVTFPSHSLLDEESLRWLETLQAEDLTDSQRMTLALMRRGDAVTNATYRQVTGLDSRIVTKELGDLVARGLIEQSGSRRWTSYRLRSSQELGAGVLPSGGRRPDRRAQIVELVRKKGTVSRAEIARTLGIPDSAVRMWLTILRKEGAIRLTVRRPRSPHARYEIAKGRQR